MGFVQKFGGSGVVLPRHSTTRVRISVIFIRQPLIEWAYEPDGDVARPVAAGSHIRDGRAVVTAGTKVTSSCTSTITPRNGVM